MITGIEVNERIPDSIIALADEVVNIDLSADDLIHRLQEGNIYEKDKIEAALANFFKPEHILQLRELALKEVASQVERKVDVEVLKNSGLRHEKFLACISSNEKAAKNVIRKTARLASYYNAHWFVLYVQARGESPDRIPLNKQRHLINNFKLATELGAKVIQVKGNNIPHCILEQAAKFDITTVCMGKPHRLLFKIIFSRSIFNGLLKGLASYDIDLIILS
jgi:two-component system sensor histidine kinase KdpD